MPLATGLLLHSLLRAARGLLPSGPVSTAVAFTPMLVLLATACGGPATSDPGPPSHRSLRDAHTPEITGINNWLNGDPTTIEAETGAGRVVLIDFWTYTCVNCLRTLPYLKSWHDRYADEGLVIIGVHSPEFEFEKDTDNVLDAMERYGVTWLVAQDNDMATWLSFRNQFWPAKYLFSHEDEIVFTHFGEGRYEETERQIRRLLENAGADLSGVPFDPLPPPAHDPAAVPIGQTREVYGGYRRNYTQSGLYSGQERYYSGPDTELLYENTTHPDLRLDGKFYLHGLWRNEAEAIVHARRTQNLEDYILVPFTARSVNVVISPRRSEPFDVYVELDGHPLLPEEAGQDVVFDERGRSRFTVDAGRMYAILELPRFREGEITLRSNSDDFAVFAFTFGTYTEGF